MSNLRVELSNLLFETGINQRIPCSYKEIELYSKFIKEKKELPDGIYRDNDGFYRVEHTDLSEEELSELFLYRQTRYLYSIKNSMIFFVILEVISILLSIFIIFA